MNKKAITWIARILAGLILAFGLPFYFGYGNPLPFINPEYTFHDNLWLTVFPLMFTGLLLGWFRPKAGGLLVVLSLGTGFLVSIIIGTGFSPHMIFPFFTGILYLIAGYKK